RIQAACRLVGEQNRRFVRDGPSNCDALLFATRKFGRLASHLILDHEELESLGQMVVMNILPDRAVNMPGHLNVAASSQRGQQIKLLKDKSDFVTANRCQAAVAHGADFLTVN